MQITALIYLVLFPFGASAPTTTTSPNIPYLLTRRDICMNFQCDLESIDQDLACRAVNKGCLYCVETSVEHFVCVGRWYYRPRKAHSRHDDDDTRHGSSVGISTAASGVGSGAEGLVSGTILSGDLRSLKNVTGGSG